MTTSFTRRHRLLARLGALGVAATFMTACTSSRSCTVVGYRSDVQVQLPTPAWSVSEFCVDEECVAGSDAHRYASIPVDDDPATHTYRLVAIDPSGETVRHSGEVQTKSFRANGPGCEPRTANAILVIGDDGSVTVRHPSDEAER